MKSIARLMVIAASGAVMSACSAGESNGTGEAAGSVLPEGLVMTYDSLMLRQSAHSVVPGRFLASDEGIVILETERTQGEFGPGNAVMVDIGNAAMGLVLGAPIEIVVEVEADPSSVQFFAAYYTFGAGNSGPQQLAVGEGAVSSSFTYQVPDVETPRHAIALWARGGSARVSSIDVKLQ